MTSPDTEPNDNRPSHLIWPTPLWHALPDDEQLLDTLIRAGCPAPCRGHRDPVGEDWHAGCEDRGRRALAVLRGWVTSPATGDVDI